MLLGQIVEIRDFAMHPTAGGMVPIQAQRLIRLLDEREALLLALKELMSRMPLTDEELDARVRLAYKAIEKAESP